MKIHEDGMNEVKQCSVSIPSQLMVSPCELASNNPQTSSSVCQVVNIVTWGPGDPEMQNMTCAEGDEAAYPLEWPGWVDSERSL